MFFEKFKIFFFLSYRHAVISGICASVEFCFFILLYTFLKLNLPFSYITSFIIATLIGFVGHSFFTFKVGRLYIRNALIFSVQASCALSIGYLLISLLINGGLHPALAKVIQLFSVFFFNVTFGKFFSFRNNR